MSDPPYVLRMARVSVFNLKIESHQYHVFFIAENVLCVVFGSETLRESDSNVIKVVIGGFNPWSVP